MTRDDARRPTDPTVTAYDTEQAVALLETQLKESDRKLESERAQSIQRERGNRVLIMGMFCAGLAVNAGILFASNQNSTEVAAKTVDQGILTASNDQAQDLQSRLGAANQRLIELGMAPVVSAEGASPNQLLLDTIIASSRIDRAQTAIVAAGAEPPPLGLSDVPALRDRALGGSTPGSEPVIVAAPTPAAPAQEDPATVAPPAATEPEPDPQPADPPATQPDPAPQPDPEPEPSSEPEPSTEPAPTEEAPAETSNDANDSSSSDGDNADISVGPVEVDLPIVGN